MVKKTNVRSASFFFVSHQQLTYSSRVQTAADWSNKRKKRRVQKAKPKQQADIPDVPAVPKPILEFAAQRPIEFLRFVSSRGHGNGIPTPGHKIFELFINAIWGNTKQLTVIVPNHERPIDFSGRLSVHRRGGGGYRIHLDIDNTQDYKRIVLYPYFDYSRSSIAYKLCCHDKTKVYVIIQ